MESDGIVMHAHELSNDLHSPSESLDTETSAADSALMKMRLFLAWEDIKVLAFNFAICYPEKRKSFIANLPFNAVIKVTRWIETMNRCARGFIGRRRCVKRRAYVLRAIVFANTAQPIIRGILVRRRLVIRHLADDNAAVRIQAAARRKMTLSSYRMRRVETYFAAVCMQAAARRLTSRTAYRDFLHEIAWPESTASPDYKYSYAAVTGIVFRLSLDQRRAILYRRLVFSRVRREAAEAKLSRIMGVANTATSNVHAVEDDVSVADSHNDQPDAQLQAKDPDEGIPEADASPVDHPVEMTESEMHAMSTQEDLLCTQLSSVGPMEGDAESQVDPRDMPEAREHMANQPFDVPQDKIFEPYRQGDAAYAQTDVVYAPEEPMGTHVLEGDTQDDLIESDVSVVEDDPEDETNAAGSARDIPAYSRKRKGAGTCTGSGSSRAWYMPEVEVGSGITGTDALEKLSGKHGITGFGPKTANMLRAAVVIVDRLAASTVTVQLLADASDDDVQRWHHAMEGSKRPSLRTMRDWVHALRYHLSLPPAPRQRMS